LQAAITDLAAQDVNGRPETGLGADLVGLRKAADLIEAEFSRRLGRFDRLRSGTRQAVSLVSWLCMHCRLSAPAAAERIEVARQLPSIPVTGAALSKGEIGYQHARVLARAVVDMGAEAVRAAETDLLASAQAVDPGRLRVVAQELRQRVDPDGGLDATNRDHERRRLRLSQGFDGLFFLEGLLDTEGGAVLMSALNALSAPLPNDSRSAVQRRADAMVELALRQLRGGELPTVAGQRPHLTVTVPAATLSGQTGSRAAALAWAGPIAASTARRLACDSTRTEVTVGPTGEPLNVGRATRVISTAIRRALVERDGGCRYPGCDRPQEWCEGHHLRHWADGGETSLRNLALLCGVHHRILHEHGWRLTWGKDGELTVIRPP